MLVRVDVAASAASGVLRCVLSHHPAGFAPYRIDNCSLETLHARQYRRVVPPQPWLAAAVPASIMLRPRQPPAHGVRRAEAAAAGTCGGWARLASWFCNSHGPYLAAPVNVASPLPAPAPSQGARAAGRAAPLLLAALRVGRAGAAAPPGSGAAWRAGAGHLQPGRGKRGFGSVVHSMGVYPTEENGPSWLVSLGWRHLFAPAAAPTGVLGTLPKPWHSHHQPCQPLLTRPQCPPPPLLPPCPPQQVGQDVTLSVPAKRGEAQRRVRVLVRTEGPTRVLTVLDTERHRWVGRWWRVWRGGGLASPAVRL